MATDQVNARGWIFEISDGAGTPVWLRIKGLKKFSLKQAENEESTDTTVFESDGVHESQAMQRGASMDLEGRFLLTDADVRDPGQARVDAVAALTGEESLCDFRFRHTVQDDWTVWEGWISLGERGGETNDKTSWGFTITKSGPASTLAVA